MSRTRRVLIAAAAVAGLLTLLSFVSALVANAASASSVWPGWLDYLRRYPWQTLLVLVVVTVALSVVAVYASSSAPGAESSGDALASAAAGPDPTTTNIVSGSANNVVQAGNIENVFIGESGRPEDIDLLREVTDSNLLVLASHAVLPTNPEKVAIDRREIRALAEIDGDFVLTGEPGCGKTGAMSRLAQLLVAAEKDVVVLSLDSLGVGSRAIRDDVVLSQPLGAVLRGWTGGPGATLLIDGLDGARDGALGWLAGLVRELDGSRWRTVATMRRFDLRYSRSWQLVFSGAPVSDQPENRERELADVRHFMLGNLTGDDLNTLAAEQPAIGRLMAGASEHLMELLRNPFNLRLACELMQSGVSEATLAEARDQLELLQRYWRARVMSEPNTDARQRVLEKLSRVMLETRRLRASRQAIPDALLDASDGLVRAGVLQELPVKLRAMGAAPLAYSHHILFDYAVAALILAVDGDSRLLPVLREDPNLVIVIRPSIDLHLADLWYSDGTHSEFAAIMAGLVQHGDSLAGIAAARTLVAGVETKEDLRWLTDSVGDNAYVPTTVTGWIVGVMEAADEDHKQQIVCAVESWGSVLSTFGLQIAQHYDALLAFQTRRLLWQLDKLLPMRSVDVPAATEWACCVARLMTSALAEPAERAGLGVSVSMFLPQAIAIDSRHSDVIRRTLQPDIMQLWDPRYLYDYVDSIDAIALGDPGLACDVLVIVLRFQEDRDDATSLSRGVVSMTSSRRQDVDLAKYHIGLRWSAFIRAAGLESAVLVLAEALKVRNSEWSGEMTGYLIKAGPTAGQVDHYGFDLAFGQGHGVAAEITKGFVAALRESDAAATALGPIVEKLVTQVSHPGAWRQLLHGAATRPRTLGLAFLPTLQTGGLLAHHDTRAAAGELITEISPLLEGAQHEALEAAILAAAALIETPPAERANHLLDQLVGRLSLDKIQDATLAERARGLREAGAAPAIPGPFEVTTSVEPATLREYLGPQEDDQLDPRQRDALETLRQQLDTLPPASSITPAEVAALEEALQSVLQSGTTSPNHIGPGSELVFRAIDALLRISPSLDPASDLAAQFIPLLLAAARGGTQCAGGEVE